MLYKQISSSSLEFLVRLLLHDNHDIAGFLTRVLVGFTVESVLAIVGRALINLSIDDFFLLGDFLTLACLAFVSVVNDFTFAITVVTWAL